MWSQSVPCGPLLDGGGGLVAPTPWFAMATTPLTQAEVVFVSCLGLGWGGPKFRCDQAAALLTAAGRRAACLELSPNQCAASSKDPWRVLATLRGAHIIFLKVLPHFWHMMTLRESACTLTLDQMDDWDYKHLCHPHDRRLAMLDAMISDNAIARTRHAAECRHGSLHKNETQIAMTIEHHHTVPCRVSDGSAPLRRALLLQEHSSDNFCSVLQHAMPTGVVFDCIVRPVAQRGPFLAHALGMNARAYERAASRPGGIGVLFAALFARYDCLIVWRVSMHTVQRLTNALATGIPVVARRCATFEEAFGSHGILMAEDATRLTTHIGELARSERYRRRISDAGVVAASRFSPANITRAYMQLLSTASATSQQAGPRRATCRFDP